MLNRFISRGKTLTNVSLLDGFCSLSPVPALTQSDCLTNSYFALGPSQDYRQKQTWTTDFCISSVIPANLQSLHALSLFTRLK